MANMEQAQAQEQDRDQEKASAEGSTSAAHAGSDEPLSAAGQALADAGIEFAPHMSSAPASHPTRVGDAGTVTSVNVSARKGTRKKPVESGQITLVEDFGVAEDAHAGDWHRQVSLLAEESIAVARQAGLDVGPGDFAENVTTEGIDLKGMPLGTRVRVGEAELEISQIGKICHNRCAIYYLAGDCIFPREGIFGWVVKPGAVRVGDSIEVLAVGEGEVHRALSDKPLKTALPQRDLPGQIDERARQIGGPASQMGRTSRCKESCAPARRA